MSGPKIYLQFCFSFPMRRFYVFATIVLFMVLALVGVIYVTIAPERNDWTKFDELDLLRRRILKLSKQYVHVVAKGKQDNGLSEAKQTAVVIENMLLRLQDLEVRFKHTSAAYRKSYAKARTSVMKLKSTFKRMMDEEFLLLGR